MNQKLELVMPKSQIDADLGQAIPADSIIGRTGLTGDSLGNGFAINSSGELYLDNQDGLFQLDTQTFTPTQIGTWTFPSELNFCRPHTMNFDSSGTLYGTFSCQDVFYLAEIDHSNAQFVSFVEITRDPLLSSLPLNMRSDALILSPVDFDFLTGNAFGTVISGFDDLTIEGSPENGLDIQSDSNSAIQVCDNTSLGLDATDLVNALCSNTRITVLVGTVDSTFEGTDDSTFEGTNDSTFEGTDDSTFEGTDGSTFTASLTVGDVITFDAETLEFTNTGMNSIVLTIPGTNPPEQHLLNPGETISLSETVPDHYLGYNAKGKKQSSDDRHSDYNRYLDYFKEYHPDKYRKFAKYLDRIDDDKYSKYLKFAKYYYEKYYKDHKHDKPSDDKLDVILIDRFEGEAKYEVKELKKLYNPVDKNNEGIVDAESHLVSYKIKGKSSFNGMKNIPISNQFGDLTVDIRKATTLLVPSAKSHDATPEELEEININHFKCYNAKESKNTPKFESRDVDLSDQFGQLKMEVKKPRMLCSPVDKNNEGIVDNENFLMCYGLKKIPGENKFKRVNVFTNNQFGPEELTAKNPNRLCVPSTIEAPDPTIKFSIPIDSVSDDAEEGNNSRHDDTMKLKSSDLDLTVESEFVGLRFNNIPLEQNQIIQNAYIQFTAEDSDKGTSTVTIYGHDTDNAPTFTENDGDISSRIPTSESVLWDIPKWKDNKSGNAQQTPELKSILQKIVDKSSWPPGNSVAFIFTDGNGADKDAYTFESSPSKAAVLHILISESEPEPDTTPPVLSLIGDNPQIINQDDMYAELGATCLDNIDGNISANIAIDSSSVDTSTPDTYQVTYDCTDSAGNSALQKIRTVEVIAVETTAPVITLNGANPLDVSHNTTYTDPGAVCVDETDPNPTLTDVSTVDTSVLDTYTVTYTCEDAAGNSSESVRTVNVVDNAPPVITLNGDPLVTLTAGIDTYVELGATVTDNDPNYSETVTIRGDAVNDDVVGTYIVTYNAPADSAGLSPEEVTRTVQVLDGTAPVITLNGITPIDVGLGDTYSDPGATCVDETDPNPTLTTVSTVDTSVLDTYTVTYTCQDTAGNNASPVVRTVNVVSQPTLTLTVSASDSNPGPFTVKVTNLSPEFNTITPGTPLGPVPLSTGTTYTVIGVAQSSHIPGTITCTNNGADIGATFFEADIGDAFACNVEFDPTSGGGGDG